MVKNFSLSMANVLTHATKTGQVIASKEKILNRIVVCGTCPDYQKFRGKCKKCGCFLVVKTGLEAEKCPRGLW